MVVVVVVVVSNEISPHCDLEVNPYVLPIGISRCSSAYIQGPSGDRLTIWIYMKRHRYDILYQNVANLLPEIMMSTIYIILWG
jgi:hypothetical protein